MIAAGRIRDALRARAVTDGELAEEGNERIAPCFVAGWRLDFDAAAKVVEHLVAPAAYFFQRSFHAAALCGCVCCHLCACIPPLVRPLTQLRYGSCRKRYMLWEGIEGDENPG